MAGAIDLAGMVPGFDFLQGLMKNSGAALPAMGQWVAPTLDPKELEKRIGELRTVQFWLEQNAKLLGTTIQALEVQRMTLATLQTMNLPMADLRDSLRINVPPVATAAPAPAAAAPATPPGKAAAAAAPPQAGAPAVDPLQWWGALTQQFTDLAARAVNDTAAAAAKPLTSPAAAPAASATPTRSAAPRKARAAPAKAAARRAR
jgi:hypothetical protein